jgi:hypothetical protein
MPGYGPILTADGDENIPVTAAGATLTLPAEFSSGGVNSGRATIQCRTAPVLFTVNGTGPTAADESTGHKLNVGDFLRITSLAMMRSLNMKPATGTSGNAFVIYEKRVN